MRIKMSAEEATTKPEVKPENNNVSIVFNLFFRIIDHSASISFNNM